MVGKKCSTCMRTVKAATIISSLARKDGRMKWRAYLECKHNRDFVGSRRPERLNCPACQSLIAARLQMKARATSFNPELVRLLQGSWTLGVRPSDDALAVVADWLEEHGDLRHVALREHLCGKGTRSLGGYLHQHFPEIDWAWLTDLTLWPYPDMEA